EGERGNRGRRHRRECPRAEPPGTIVASVTGLPPSMTSLAMLTIPPGDAGQFALSGLISCGLSAPFGFRSVNPLRGKTTDWKAGCGKSACPVWREGGRTTASPYP